MRNSIKFRISIFVSVSFTLIFGLAATLIIFLFSNFRKDEFKERLQERALTSIKLLIEVKEVDNQLLKIIDKNTINELYNDKTLIFDDNKKLIYSSLDDTEIDWDIDDLNYLEKNKTFFKKSNENEIYGIYYNSNQGEYYALISANDNYGNRKLEFLIYIVIAVFILMTSISWGLTFLLMRKELNPLEHFINKLKDINANNLNTRINSLSNNIETDEIQQLKDAFNFMLSRIESAYKQQVEFASQASHELQTPLTRLSFQLENLIQSNKEQNVSIFKNLFEEVNQINSLVYSLMTLARSENLNIEFSSPIFIDEVIYTVIDRLGKIYPNIKINLKIHDFNDPDKNFDVIGDQTLFEIVFFNLIKNAYLYSNSRIVNIEITFNENLEVTVSNNGPILSIDEQKLLFLPFMRGKNSVKNEGLGLGLRIVFRILNKFGYSISYNNSNGYNNFTITF